MKQYCEAQIIDQIVLEKELLTTEQQYNEYVMTSLRTSWGCDTEHIYNVFGEKYARFFTDKVQQYIRKNQIQQLKSIYKLTQAGKLFADGIAAGLFHDF
jgi:oxygen-independent coproporphyrinogen-3 oxidase